MRFAYLCCDVGVQVFGTAGSSVHVREVSEALSRLGHVVEVFSPSPSAELGSDARGGFHHLPLTGCAQEVRRLLRREPGQAAHLGTELGRILYSEHLQRSLEPLLAAFRPDVIYERYSLFAYAGLEVARTIGAPLLLEVNAPLSREAAKYRELVLRRTAEELERRILCSADGLIVVSTALEQYARELGVDPRRITVLPNGVNPERFHPSVPGGPVRSRYGLDGKQVIGFVGTLKRWHDLDTLLAATTLLSRADHGVHLLVVGEGPRMEQLQGLQEDYITCTGAVEHERVPEFIAAMDVVVVPYSQGGDSYFSPLKLFEAMAMAKPIVGARIGQVAEILVHGQNGLLYEPGHAEDLAVTVRAALDAARGQPDLGAAARRTVLAGRTWEANAREIVRIAQSVRHLAGDPDAQAREGEVHAYRS